MRLAPRRWSQRARLRDADIRLARLPLLAGAVLSLVRATSAALEEGEVPSSALGDALHDLTSSFAALAESGDAGASEAAAAATRVCPLTSREADGPGAHAPLIARLAQACARDVLRVIQ